MTTILNEIDILRKNVNDLQNELGQARKKIVELQEENKKLADHIDALSIDLAFYKDEIGGTGA